MTTPPTTRPWLLAMAIAAALLCSCASNYYNVGMQIKSEGQTSIALAGDVVRVVIHNDGPGPLYVVIPMTVESGTHEEDTLQAGHTLETEVRGGSVLLLSTDPGKIANIKAELWSDGGIAVSGAAVIHTSP